MVAAPIAHLHSFGSYEVIRKLGAGGMAEVFLARQHMASDVSRIVVIKALLPHLASDKQFVEMFEREAKIAALLTHPNIVQIYDVTNIDGRPSIVMEFLRGRDLWNVLRQVTQTGARVPPQAAAAIIAQAASGLDHAHRLRDERGRPIDLVHRDISPQNLFLTRDGHLRVLDFGIAKSRYQEQRTQEGVLKGKLPYMAPEQARSKDLDGRADQFALGVILWEMLVGKRLFSRDDPFHTMNALFTLEVPTPSVAAAGSPPELDAVVLRVLSRPVQDRYESCEALAQALRDWLRKQNAPSEVSLVTDLLEDAFPISEDAVYYGFDAQGTSTSVRNPDLAGGRTRVDAQTLASAGVGDISTGLRPTPRKPAGPLAAPAPSRAAVEAKANAIAAAETAMIAMPSAPANAQLVTQTVSVALETTQVRASTPAAGTATGHRPALPIRRDGTPSSIIVEPLAPPTPVLAATPAPRVSRVWLIVAGFAGATALAAGVGITAAVVSGDPEPIVTQLGPAPLAARETLPPPPVAAPPAAPRDVTVRFLMVPGDVSLEVDGEPLSGSVLTTRSSALVRHVRALRGSREVWRYDGMFQDSTAVALPDLSEVEPPPEGDVAPTPGGSRPGGRRHPPRGGGGGAGTRPPPGGGGTGLGNGIDMGYP